MLQTKTTKRGIIDRLINLDKATMISKKPHLVLIEQDDTKGYKIVEHYYNINNSYKHKELFYEDYNEYLSKANLDKNTPVIINDLPRFNEREEG